jgi:D-alanyl-lipoteichoic acid acyltransferase DltB (MBOAT superfamily)
MQPWDSFLDYALFLTFFPHLVSGPIVRAEDFLPQCRTPRRANSTQIGWGLSLMILGLFEKMVLADGVLAPAVEAVFGAPNRAGFLDAWVGTLAFSGQIFFDFAGYSICGIGAALVLGFVLNDNFHFPYAAIGFSDFWKRWHISLSTWLRDYLYISLGGNRVSKARVTFNLMLTMLLGGLWHGAAWRFVAWGGLHGAYLAGERTAKQIFGDVAILQSRLARVGLMLMTYGLVCIAWVPFRANSFRSALHLFKQMATPSRQLHLIGLHNSGLVLPVIAAVLIFQWLMRDTHLETVAAKMPWWTRSCVMALMVLCIVLAPGDTRAFIYFQF